MLLLLPILQASKHGQLPPLKTPPLKQLQNTNKKNSNSIQFMFKVSLQIKLFRLQLTGHEAKLKVESK